MALLSELVKGLLARGLLFFLLAQLLLKSPVEVIPVVLISQLSFHRRIDLSHGQELKVFLLSSTLGHAQLNFFQGEFWRHGLPDETYQLRCSFFVRHEFVAQCCPLLDWHHSCPNSDEDGP